MFWNLCSLIETTVKVGSLCNKASQKKKKIQKVFNNLTQ